jgi:signal peptidase I
MKGWMKVVLWLSIVLGVVLGVIKYWLVEFYEVPNTPLEPHVWANAPNVEPGDYLLTWRAGIPHLGELVLCTDPQAPSQWMIGRVIGIGGDAIETMESGLKINNFRVAYNPCLQHRKLMGADGAPVEFACTNEDVGGHHDVNTAPIYSAFTAKVDVGKLFLMSDTRGEPYAYDSRMPEVGQIPIENCPQRIMMRIVSKDGWADGDRRMSWLF